MHQQRGGMFVGFIVGLLVGLALALGVALYVTKVPVPFIDKVPKAAANQDAAEAERNRTWNPNDSLASKVPVRPAASAPSGPAGGIPDNVTAAAVPPGGIAALQGVASGVAAAVRGTSLLPGAVTAAARAGGETSARSGGEPFVYFVQIGAYGRNEDAEQQRARLAMAGMTAKITEREQSGRTVYRVRLGPFDVREAAEAVKQQATDGGFADAALVRVQR